MAVWDLCRFAGALCTAIVGAGMGGMGAYSGGMRYGDMGQDGQGAGTSGKTRPHDFVEGKLFLGGLDAKTTKDSLAQYCQHWYGLIHQSQKDKCYHNMHVL